MKRISILILAIFLFAGCNNVDEILSNFKNLTPSQDTKEETEIKEEAVINDKQSENYQYEDVCDLFFNDPETIRGSQILYIAINAVDQLMCDYKPVDIYNIESIIDSFLYIHLENTIFLIHSEGSIETDQKILGIINRGYKSKRIRKYERSICLMRDEALQRWKDEMEIKPPPPPPPPPPQAIIVVEDDVEVEVEDLIGETETDEDEIIYIEEEDDDEIFMVVEEVPEFPCLDFTRTDSEGRAYTKEYCGYEGLTRFFRNNVEYPAMAKEYNITGKVYVQFVIEKDGEVTNVKVIRGVEKSLDEEAVRVVSLMPNWKPGMKRGKNVRVYFTVPINFNLN